MPSSWIIARPTKDGGKRFLVRFRLGGRESQARHAGSFKTKTEALARKRWVDGELAALRVPNVTTLEREPTRAPTLEEAAERWRKSRVDVADQTSNMHRSAFVRIFRMRPQLRSRLIDALTVADVADLVAALAAAGYKRETLRKSRTALAQTLDFFAITPNPVRDERVKLPRERKTHLPPPLAEHVEQVLRLVARRYVLPLSVLDECGPRVTELETALVGDLDEERPAIRVPDAEKNERYRYLHLPDDLFAALLATLPPREDRDPEAPLFHGVTYANLRIAIARACKAGGVPHFSPHALRRRRGSLHYKRTGSLARLPSSSETRNGSPPTTTSMRSSTTGRSTGSRR